MAAAALGRAFLQAWGGTGAAAAPLEAGLKAMLAAARKAWPSLEVSDEDFVRFVAARVPADGDPARAVAGLSAADLYLVCGCVARDEAATGAFRDHVEPVVRAAVRRVGGSAVEDLEQELYRRLFLPEPGKAAKIEQYAGHGDVRTWVGVVAARMAIDVARKRSGGPSLDEQVLERLMEGVESSEFEHLRREYRREFKLAFGQAVTDLEARDRNVLRYHLDGLTADQIGRIHNVHRVTVARWLARIRFALLEGTRTSLRDRLGTDRRDVESIMRMLDGEVSLSIERLLDAD